MNLILPLACSTLRNPLRLCRAEAGSKNKARLFSLLITVALFTFTEQVNAATIPVTTNADSGAGSLREAIAAANSNADPDVIKFDFSGIIQLESPLPDLVHELQIRGARATALIVEPKPGVKCRIFTVATGATVTISDITIRNGIRTSNIVGGNGNGGGVHNSGTLTLRRCEIRGNQAIGANNSNGNGGIGRGGGIYNSGTGTLTLDHCTVAENRAAGGAGSTNSGLGGPGEGGAIYNVGRLTILSSTVSTNLALGGKGNSFGASNGGGLFSGIAPVNPVLTSCTVSNNTADFGGGLSSGSQPCTIRSTILAENSAAIGPECSGSLNSHDYNLIQSTSGCSISGQTGHNVIDTPADIGPLQNNGGPTRTHALLSGSPAIGNGDDAIVNAPLNITTDQRLVTRNVGGVDIGAFEFGGQQVPSEDFNGDGKPDLTLFRSSDRKTALWYLTGTVFAGSAYGPTPPAGWAVVDCGDFNRDGQTDYLLFNSSTRQMATWFLANAALIGAANGPTLPEGWTLVGGGDFTGDTGREYLLFKPATGQTGIWLLDGPTIAGAYYGPTVPAGWSLVGAADFGGNPLYDDYLLYHAATRKTAVWFLDGFAFDHGTYGPIAPSGWAVVGVADFNTNDKPDLVFFNASTRETAIWYLNGTTFVSAAYGPPLPSGWQLVSP